MPVPQAAKKEKLFSPSKLSLRDAVAQFEEKGGYLKDFRLRKFLATTDLVVAFDSSKEGFGENHAMPDLEMILAYASVVRYFLIEKDGFSLGCMATFYKNHASPAHQALFEGVRDALDDTFSRQVRMCFNQTPRTYGEWFEEELWGDLTHFNPEDYPLVHEMKRNPFTQQWGLLDFFEALGVFYQCVQRIRALNRIAFPSAFNDPLHVKASHK